MEYFSPKEITQHFCNNGIYKSKLSTTKFIVLAILGGVFIALGGLLTVMVAGGMPGIGASNPGLVKFVAGALFPVGLIMVTVTGADLFTSDCAGMTFPVLTKQAKITDLLRIWTLSYFFNFVGAVCIAYFFAYYTELITASPFKEYVLKLAEKKLHYGWDVVFIKGIGANWLVCLGTFMGLSAKDTVGRALGIWIPVMLFVTLGYEHSIANMFFIPAAIFSGSEITWGHFIIDNLIPATLGNIVGGAFFVGCVYWYTYLKDNK